MEDSWEDLVSHRELGDDDDEHFFNQSHMSSFNEEEFLSDIIIQQAFSLESDKASPNPPPPSNQSNHGAATPTRSTTNGGLSLDETRLDMGHGTLLKCCSSSNNIISLEKPSPLSPMCFILSSDNPVVEPVHSQLHDSALMSSKSRPRNHCIEPRAHQRTKKTRNASETKVHIMAERERRQELTRSIVALAATIPGLKKADKGHVLREAVHYVKQLQERIRELENQNRIKERVDSIIVMKKTQLCTNEASRSCETHTDGGCCGCIEELPEVEATVSEKEVLIGIHCEKQKQSFLKILSLFNNLHLSITSSSVLPFGTSTVKITIVAQMDDEYNMTIDDLVKTLRQHLLNLKSQGMQKLSALQ